MEYMAFVTDSKVSLPDNGKVIYVYPPGQDDKVATAVAVDTGRTIEYTPDRLNPDVIFLSETFDGIFIELEKRGWMPPPPPAYKPLNLPETPAIENVNEEEPGLGNQGPCKPIGVEASLNPNEIPNGLQDSNEGIAKMNETMTTEVTQPTITMPTVTPKTEKTCPKCGGLAKGRGFAHTELCKPEKTVKTCPKCGGISAGRGYAHVVGCSESTAVKLAAKKVSQTDKPAACPACGGLPRGRGYTHAPGCSESTAAKLAAKTTKPAEIQMDEPLDNTAVIA